MFHWQWFVLVITVCFVVSNGGERIPRTRFHKRKRETENPTDKFSTEVIYPLWVTIGGLDSIGGDTQYTQISDDVYEFELPFLVLVKKSDVSANRSAVQREDLGFPFWVKITQLANQTSEGLVRLTFPFDLEVARVSLLGSDSEDAKPEKRVLCIISATLVGSIALAGAVAVAAAVVASIVGAVLVAIVVVKVLRAAIIAVWEAAVELFRPHCVGDNCEIPKPKTGLGNLVGAVAGVIVSFVPVIGPVIQSKIVHIFQTFGDSMITFVKELSHCWVLGVGKSIGVGISVVINLFGSLPFTSWGKNTGVLKPPPTIVFPKIREPSDQNKIIIEIFYGQTSIPGFPEYKIAWPGKEEPLVTDHIILRPIIPTLPKRPNVRLVWPMLSSTVLRPNVIIIQTGQRFLPGYVNVLILWHGEPNPLDTDIIVIRPGDPEIPNIIGVVLIWPNMPTNHGPYHIILSPGQRQDPQFPTIIFTYPGDLIPPIVQGITVVSSPQTSIPGYPSITITWPPAPGSSPPQDPRDIKVCLNDFQVPGLPSVVIVPPGSPQPPPAPGITYLPQGETTVPGYPSTTLTWLQQPAQQEKSNYTTVLIVPETHTVPGFPEYVINRPGSQPSNSPKCVKPGDKTLPDNPNVMLVWLDRPTDLILEPSPDIYQSNFIYDDNIMNSRDKRSIGVSVSSLNLVDDSDTSVGGHGNAKFTLQSKKEI